MSRKCCSGILVVALQFVFFLPSKKPILREFSKQKKTLRKTTHDPVDRQRDFFWKKTRDRGFQPAAELLGEFVGKPTRQKYIIPIGSMYGISTYIYHENHPNVGKYTSPMDPMGYQDIKIRASNMYGNSYWKINCPRKHFQLWCWKILYTFLFSHSA